jgi:hypothetical protein
LPVGGERASGQLARLELADGDAGVVGDANEAVGARPAAAFEDVHEGVASDANVGGELPP